MSARDLFRTVLQVDPPSEQSAIEQAAFEYLFGQVWNRPGLSIRDRRLVSLVCASAAVDVPEIEAQVYGALKSGDLTLQAMNEFTLHFAVYCGWPRGSQVEVVVRAQSDRIHHERGETRPAQRPMTAADLGILDPDERIALGAASFAEINLVPAPPSDSAYYYAGILNYVFGHVWHRRGLSRRDRRLITVASVGVCDAMGPIWSHVTSALSTGDLTYEEMDEQILQFRAYAGETRADVLRELALRWQAEQS